MSDAALPAPGAVMAQAGAENFPVALRVLAPADRRRLMAIYGFARLADELGDELEGDRLAALDWLEGELDRAYAGTAEHPLMKVLAGVLAECPLPREPFRRLVEANRLDQRVAAYETFAQLESYCSLSANPVGELVLYAFGLATPERIALSDEICTALQLAEHWQDVVEDAGRGRVYLPGEDLERFGVEREELLRLAAGAAHGEGGGSAAVPSSPRAGSLDARMRRLMAFEVDRAGKLLSAGAPLIDAVPGRRKLAIAGFFAGGQAALAAIAERGFDVLSGAPKAGRAKRAAVLVRALVGRSL